METGATFPVLRNTQRIHQLEKRFSPRPIRVCIRNTWDIMMHQPDNYKKCTGFICYDSHRVLLEGRLTNNTHTTDLCLLTEGDTYEFSRFFVKQNTREGKLTRLPYTVRLNQWSTMVNVSLIDPIVAAPRFCPRDYESLLRLSTAPRYLPDVVGEIRQMQNIRSPSPEPVGKITVVLMLSGFKKVGIVLWGNPGREFTILQSKKNRKYKTVLITSLIPKLYRGQFELSSSPATTFFFSKTINHIKNYIEWIENIPHA